MPLHTYMQYFLMVTRVFSQLNWKKSMEVFLNILRMFDIIQNCEFWSSILQEICCKH